MCKSNRQNEIDSILATIRKSAELTLFFDRLCDNTKAYWKLFFTHKDILLIPLPIKGQFLPLICWTSANYLRHQAKLVEQPLDTTVHLAKARGDVLSENFLGLGSELVQVFRDIIPFYTVKFVRANPKLQELVQNEEFDFAKTKQVIGDARDLNINIFEELKPLSEWEGLLDSASQSPTLPTDDSALASSILRLFRMMTDVITASPETFMEMPQATLWASILPLHIGLGQWLPQFLETIELDIDEYTDIMSELYNLELVNNFHNAFWCISGTHQPFVLTSASKTPPPRHSIKCPTCNQTLVTNVLYKLDKFIFDAIKFHDGLLAIVIAQLLFKNNQKFEFGYRINDAEIDFFCIRPEGNIGIETKVHRTDIDERQLANNLKDDIIKLGKNIKKFLELGERIDKSYIIVNFDTSYVQDVIDSVKGDSKVKTVWRELPAEINIVGPLQIKETLSKLGLIQK